MKIFIAWTNEKDVSDLSLRVEIKDISYNSIASAVFYNFYAGKSGEKASLKCSVPLNSFVTGKYTLVYTFFLKDLKGQNKDVDCVHGPSFEIRNDDVLRWNHKAWGYLQIKGCSLLEVK